LGRARSGLNIVRSGDKIAVFVAKASPATAGITILLNKIADSIK
jgi:hypothetical protein